MSKYAGFAGDNFLLRDRVEQLERVLPVAVKVIKMTVRYSDSNKGSARSSEFKDTLVKMSGIVDSKVCCCVLDVLLPRNVVIGAHIFKREWSYFSKELLDIENVDDTRNGAVYNIQPYPISHIHHPPYTPLARRAHF